MKKREIRQTQRWCKCINEIVNLTAEVSILYQGTSAVEVKIYVVKWLDCDKKDTCSKRCNYFYASPDCNACDEKDLINFP